MLEVGSSFGCAETVRKVWLTTETMLINVDGLPVAYARTHGSALEAWIRKEEGESGWGKILEIIAERDQLATRKRKRGVKVKRQKKNKTYEL